MRHLDKRNKGMVIVHKIQRAENRVESFQYRLSQITRVIEYCLPEIH